MGIDWNVVSRVIPRDVCIESYGKLSLVLGTRMSSGTISLSALRVNLTGLNSTLLHV